MNCFPEDFEINIDGPGKADVTKKEESNGVVHVAYMPLSPGEYDLNIKHLGKPIHGSPFSVKVSGTYSTRLRLPSSWSGRYVIRTRSQ